MKHADIAIMANGSGRLGHYGVDPARYSGYPGAWPKSSRLMRLIGDWLERRSQRRALTQLDDRMLNDIGITRLDVEHEITKPFWQP